MAAIVDHQGARPDARRSGDLVRRRLPLVLSGLALPVFLAWSWNPAYRHDEYLVAVSRTQLSWERLIAEITSTHPGGGFLYLLMKPWTAVSADPGWTRLPSVFAMAVAVGGLVAFVRRAVDTPTAVFAGLLMILMPATTRWAQDNRMYALATACAVLAARAGGDPQWWLDPLVRALRSRRGRYGGFHLYALTVAPALSVAALWAAGASCGRRCSERSSRRGGRGRAAAGTSP